MLERLWTSILDLVAQFVTPDWGAVIGLLPVVILILVVVVLVRTFLMLMRAPPPRRGKAPIKNRTPPGIHLPGPSFAPVFAAVGLFLVMLGLVFGGGTLVLGLIALVLTLLYWLGEGLRLYDRDIGPTAPAIPAVVHDGPPPGVHMPGPSWRPFLGAFGLFSLLLGLVFGGWLLIVGVIALVSTLVGWLGDAVKEFRRTVDADTTGHLENGPAPRTPSRLLGVLIVLIVGAAVLQSGAFSAGSANGGVAGAGSPAPPGAPASGAPGSGGPPPSGPPSSETPASAPPASAPAASGAPASPPPASGAPASGATASGAPASGGPPPASGVAADVRLEAKEISFLEASFTAPAGRPFTIAFANEDDAVPHNVALKDGSGAVVWKGDIFNGIATRIYQVPALPAGGYTFLCLVHPTAMTGTATLQ